MLSATAETFDDPIVEGCESTVDVVAAEAGLILGELPSSIPRCMVFPFEPSSCEPFELCTLPTVTFEVPGEAEPLDPSDPSDVETSVVDPVVDPIVDPVVDTVVDPGSTDGGDAVVDPIIIVDPVEPLPVPFEPVDVRVQFVSSDAEYACYYYLVGSDGAVAGVTVVASYDEPSIVAFLAAPPEDGSFSIEDTGGGWVIHNFPLDLAPPVPETGVFSAISDPVDQADETAVDPIPDSEETDREPVLFVCDPVFVYDLPVCDLPDAAEGAIMARNFGAPVPFEAADSGSQPIPTAAGLQAPAPAATGMTSDVMAAFAANAHAAGGEATTLIGTPRRRR